MSPIRTWFALTLALVAVSAAGPAEPATRPIVIGHRGAWGRAPENTIVGFWKAIELGADMLELDVRLTGPDGRGKRTLVVHHDRTLTRTTNCRGRLAETPLSTIRRCDAGYGTKDPRDTRWRGLGIRIPALSEVFATFPRARLNIDLKFSSRNTDDLLELQAAARELAHFLTARAASGNRGLFKRVIVSSIDSIPLEVVKALEPRTITALVTSVSSDTVATSALKAKALGHDLSFPSNQAADLTIESVRAMHAAGHTVIVHTVNATATIRRLLRYGVDGMYTDYPDRVRRALDQTVFRSSRACVASLCI